MIDPLSGPQREEDHGHQTTGEIPQELLGLQGLAGSAVV